MKRIITLLLLVFTFNISASALFSPPVCVTESYDTVGTIATTGIICDNYLWNGLFITVSGDYVATLPNANSVGCDSIAYLHAIIEYSTSTYTQVTECDSYTWAINGQTYSTSGIYTATSTNAAGCNHTDTLDLTIDYSYTKIDTIVSCNSYTWIDGITYTSSTDALSMPIWNYSTTVGGCDSTIYLLLTINDSTFNTNPQTACDSYTWAAPLGDGNTYTTSGTYTHVSTNAQGCIHTETLDLTINSSTTNTNTVDTCDTFIWAAPLGNGTTYTTSGTYTHISTNAQGCQHTETLNLTINYSNSDTNQVSAIVCNFYTDPLGNTYDTSAIYTYIMPNSVGCDSVIRLDLTVNFPDSSFTTHSACDSYTWNGTTYTTSGLYPYNTQTVVGNCDSVAMLDLFVGYSEIHVTTVNACDNYVWFDANGDTIYTATNQDTALSGYIPGNYGLAGVFSDTLELTNIGGCDSIVVLNLTLSQNIVSSSQAVDIYACESWTNPYNNQVYTVSGSYSIATGSTPSGCDTIESYSIHITPEKRDDIFVTECDTYTWIIENDQGVNDTSVYTASTLDSVVYTGIVNYFTGNNGNTTDSTVCDSTVYLHLTITNSEVTTITDDACDSYFWATSGLTYTSSVMDTVVLQNGVGCDSTVILDLTINNSTTGTNAQTACDSYTWAPPLGDGNTYTTSGTHTHVSTNAAGCDHTETLVLTINPNYTVAFVGNPVVACDSYHWPLANGGQGVTYTASGNYSATFQTVDNCDSTVVLDLTINNSTTGTNAQTACDSYTWAPPLGDGNTYTTSGTHTHVSTNAAGCDHTETLVLLINNTSSSHTVIDTCDSYTWSVDGSNYNSTGIYTNTYTNASGCLHTDSLDLTIRNSNSGANAVTACDSYTWNNTTYTTSGTYQATFQNVSGCDSVHTLTLTIDNTVVTHDTATSCDSYTWNPPVSILSFTFDTTSTFNAGINSLDYWVMGNSNGNSCTDTSYLYLTINPTITHMATIDACSPYTWNGTTYDSTGIYIDTLISAALCDSIVTLHLTVDSNIITPGCTDSIACNYFAAACVDDGSCTYPAVNANCSGACLPGFVSVNGVCVPLTPSWDCVGTTCVDPGTGNGTYSSLAACNAACGTPAPSWNCVGTTCVNPGNGQGTYSSLAACNAACGAPAPSWNCVGNTCVNPGNGQGTYTSLAACNAACGAPAPSWNCVGNTCVNPGNGQGTYTSLAACNAACGVVTPSWDCVGTTCVDPGTGNGTYTSLAACNAACGVVTPSWDCVGTTCVDPGTGNGTYTSLATCQTACGVTPSWDCVGATCIDPGTGNGIYTSLAACNAACGVATPSWDCVGTTCVDPGTGNGTYASLAACQAVCSIVSGCTDSTACNYNPSAVIDDGSCVYGQTTSTTSVTECDSYTWNGTTYTSSGSYTFTTVNAVGCDSIATLDLVILNGPSVIIQQNASNMSMLDAIVTGGTAPYTYAWTQDSISLSSNGTQIEPLENGEYCVVVTDAAGCISTACFTISFFPPNSINESSISKLKIYPNPTSQIINLDFTTKTTSDYDIQILSVTGVEVYSDKLIDVSGSYKGVIDLSTYSQGTYILHIVSDDNIVYRKLIKQ